MRPLSAGELDPLTAQLRRRRLLLCAGGALTRDGSLRRLIGELLDSLPDSQDARDLVERRPLMAADLVRRRLGARFAPALAALTASDDVGEALRALGALPFSSVLTTAYDHAVERAFARDGSAVSVHLPSQVPPQRIPAHGRAVWKLLGDPDREETIVWGAADLQRALATEGYRTISRELFRTQSFLFVGFDSQAVELMVLLERVLSDAPSGEVDHYALLPDVTELDREHLYAIYRIRTLSFDTPLALARALRDALGDPRRAVPADDDPEGWLALLREDPTRADVTAQLDRLGEQLRAAGDHEARVGLCVGRAELEADPARHASLLTEAASILEEDLADPGRAFTALLAAHAEHPSEPLWSRLAALGTASGRLPLLAEHAAELAARLPTKDAVPVRVRLARLVADAPALVEALAQSLPLASSAAQRCAIHTELGQLYDERLGDPLAAAACFQVAIETDPLAEAPQRLLEALLLRRGDHETLVRSLELRMATAFGVERRALLARIADLYADQLAAPAEAVLRYQELLLDAPAEPKLLWRMALLWHRQPKGGPRAVEYLERLLVVTPRDEQVFAMLEQIYSEARDWHMLLDTYRRHAVIASPATRTALWLEAGALCERDLQDPGLALQAYLEVDRAEPDQPAALAALTRLYEATQDHARAIAVIERRAAGAADARQRAELHHHAGELARQHVGDARGGKPHFARAIAADPSYLPPTQALVELHRQHGDFLDAARLLLDVAGHAGSPQRTRFLIEAGELFEAAQDPGRAISAYLQALEVDPAHVEAATRACVLLRAAGRNQELMPIIETLAHREAPRAVRIDRQETLATAAMALGDLGKALRAYETILVLSPTHVGGLRGRAEVLFQQEDWATAVLALDQLREHEHALSTPARVELHHRRGVCALRQNRADDARDEFDRARALDPAHRPSLLALLDLGEPDVASLIRTKRGLTKTASSDERRRLWTDIGDLYIDKLENPIEAIAAWTAGLEARPNDLPLLHRLMRLHVEQKSWTEALAVLGRLIDNDSLPVARAKYRYTAGMICLEHIGRFADAADHLWASVEDDPTLERARLALETMLRNHKSWKELARLYRWSLKQLDTAVGDTRDRQLQLWSALGELCLTRLHDTEAALLALEVALRLDPKNLERQQQLARAYALAGPAYLDRSIAARQQLLSADKANPEAYRALSAVYGGNGQARKAAACERAIAALGEAKLPGTELPLPTLDRPLSEEAWARLRHPGEDPLLSSVFALVAPIVVASMAQRSRTPIDRNRLVPPGDKRRFARVLRQAARALAVSAPGLDVAPEQEDPASFAVHLDETVAVPVLTIGAPLLEPAATDEELWFLAGRCLALLRPERLLRWLLPLPQQLAHLLEATAALASGATASGELGKTVAGLRRELTPVSLDHLVGLGHALGASSQTAGERALGWLVASDHTATRAGYVLCGDLATCRDSITRGQRPERVAPQAQRIIELVWSSVTEEIFAVQDLLQSQGPTHVD